MVPFILSAQRMATHGHDLWPGTLQEQKGDGGSGGWVEEQDTPPKLSDHSDTSSGHSNRKTVPMSTAKAVSKPVRTATTTHKTGPKPTPMSAFHPKSSPHAAHKRPSRTSIHRGSSPTPTSEIPKPIPTSLSLPHSSSIPPPFQDQPRSEHSPSPSPPPPQTHSLSSHSRTIAAIVGSISGVGLLVVLCILLRCYLQRNRRIKRSKLPLNQKRKAEEAHPRKKSKGIRESLAESGIEMVRLTQGPRRDFSSQFSPSLESQLQRDTDDQNSYNSEGETVLRLGQVPRRHPLVLERAISYFSLPSPVVEGADEEREISSLSLPSPVVGVAGRAAAVSSGETRIVYPAEEEEEEDGGDVGRVVSLGDSCVIEMLVRVMDDDERRGEDERVGIVSQEGREIDGVVVTVANLGTRVVESAEDGVERRVEGEESTHGDLDIRVEDGRLHRRELDSENEGDDCSFKSTRASIGLDDSEGGKSGEEQTEGASQDVPAARRVEVIATERVRAMMGLNSSK